jgi:hypothetical protein
VRSVGPAIFAILAALFLLGQGVPLYTDWLWFQEVQLTPVFLTTWKYRLAAGVAFGLPLFLFLYANLRLSGRGGAGDVLLELDDQFGLPNRLAIEPQFRRLLLPATFFVGLLGGIQAAAEWETFLRALNRVPFAVQDPLYLRDVGFYVFTLPAMEFVYHYLLVALALALAGTAFAYLLYGGIQITARGPVIAGRARTHLLILAAGLFAVYGAGLWWIRTADLLFSAGGVVFGAKYQEVHAVRPALQVLAVISWLCALCCLIQLRGRGFRLALTAFGVLVAGQVVGLGLYPSLLQRFTVTPNEIEKERPFIEYNIRATRQAYGLDKIEEEEFPAEENLTAEDLRRNDPTIKNVRLWEHGPLLTTYAQIQEIRPYYRFVDVDNDRYTINNEIRQVMLSARELDHRRLPGERTWINEHLIYTHGHGVVVGPVNRVTPEGLPDFFIKDIPPMGNLPAKIERPEIYFGEVANDYVIVKTKREELDYPSGEKNVYTTYQGKGGVLIGSYPRRLLFAIRFGKAIIPEINILLNTDIAPESRILYYRQVDQRVRQAAPFLQLERDPYLVISKDGRLFWMLDAYTTTSRYPYSTRVEGTRAARGEVRPGMNYIRNSVKAVVDAYDGSIGLYISEPADPIVQAYARAFSGVLKPLNEMPEDLRAHIRYPSGMFAVQARMFVTYHMTDPQVFYNKEDLWSIPRRTQETRDAREVEMEPYYTIMRFPGETKEEFILLIPYNPRTKDNMSAWLAARSDPPHYGKLIVFTFPKAKLVYGPRQIEARIEQDSFISQQLTLWRQGGSQVLRGSLLAIPVEKSLLYVSPLYLAAEKGSLPELKRVIVAFGNQIAMEETLERSLQRVFGGRPVGDADTVAGAAGRGPASSGSGAAPAAAPVATLAARASDHYARAQEHLRKGNWAGFGDELKRMEETLKQLRDAAR